jgi:hypothetical protein
LSIKNADISDVTQFYAFQSKDSNSYDNTVAITNSIIGNVGKFTIFSGLGKNNCGNNATITDTVIGGVNAATIVTLNNVENLNNVSGDANVLLFRGNNTLDGNVTISTGNGANNVIAVNNLNLGANGGNIIIEDESFEGGKIIINQSFASWGEHLEVIGSEKEDGQLIFAGKDIHILSSDSVFGKTIKLENTTNDDVKDYIADSGRSNFILSPSSVYLVKNGDTTVKSDMIVDGGVTLRIDSRNWEDDDQKNSIIRVSKLEWNGANDSDNKITISLNFGMFGKKNYQYTLFEFDNLIDDLNGNQFNKDYFNLSGAIKSISYKKETTTGKIFLYTFRSFDSILENSKYKNDSDGKIYDGLDNYIDFARMMTDSYNKMTAKEEEYVDNPQMLALTDLLQTFNYYDGGDEGEFYMDADYGNDWEHGEAKENVKKILDAWLFDPNVLLYENSKNNFRTTTSEIKGRMDGSMFYGDVFDNGMDASFNYALATAIIDNDGIFNRDYSVDKNKRNIADNWFKIVYSGPKSKKNWKKFKDNDEFSAESINLMFGKDLAVSANNYIFGILFDAARTKIDAKLKTINITSYSLSSYGRANFLNSYFYVSGIASVYYNIYREASRPFNIEYKAAQIAKQLDNTFKIRSSYDSLQASSIVNLGFDTRYLVLEGFVNHNILRMDGYRDNLKASVDNRIITATFGGGRAVLRKLLDISIAKGSRKIFEVKPEIFVENYILLDSSFENLTIGLNESNAKYAVKKKVNLEKDETRIGGNLNLVFNSRINIQLSYSVSSDKNISYGVGGYLRF